MDDEDYKIFREIAGLPKESVGWFDPSDLLFFFGTIVISLIFGKLFLLYGFFAWIVFRAIIYVYFKHYHKFKNPGGME